MGFTSMCFIIIIIA